MALGALDIIIAADTAQLRKGMDEAVGIMKSSTKTMESAAKTAAGAIAGYFAFDSIKGSIQHTLDFADSLSKMSQKVGVSVDALYAMQAAGKLADVNLETLEKSLLKFNKGLGSAELGTGNTVNALKNLGISLKDSAGHLKTSDQYLFEVADRFKEMPNGIAKSTLAMELFGKSGADMIPLLNGGSEALKEYSGIINTETAQAAERFNDSMTKIGLSAEASATKILTGMLPTIESLSSTFEDMVDWVLKNQSTIDEFTAQAGNDLTALGMVGYDAFNLISDTSGDMLKTVASVFNQIPGLMGRSSDDAIENFGFFEYFILGMSTATNSIGQFVANAKMAYASVAEAHAKYGSISGLLTDGGYDAAKARMDYHAADLEAKKYTENVSATYNTLLGLKKEYKAKNGGSESPIPNFELENFDKPKTGKTQAEKDAESFAKLDQKLFDERINDGIKRFQDEIVAKEKADQEYLRSSETMYSAINDASGNWYDNEIVNISNRAAEFAAAGNDIVDIERYVSASILSIDEKRAKEQADLAQKTFEEQNKFWFDLMGNINKAMEPQFFDVMTGKFESFGSWLKDMWASITDSMARGLSKTLADWMMGGVQTGVQNIFTSFGGFSGALGAVATPAALIGATTDSAGFTTTIGGTVMDAAGQITKEGSDISSVIDGLSNISSLKSLYNLASGGLEGIAAKAWELQGSLQSFANFGSFNIGGLSGSLGGMALGGLGGYALGSIGDKLFATSTKAGSYGAIGGAIGSLGGIPGFLIGSAIGSIIGGFQGKDWISGQGYKINSATSSSVNGQRWAQTTSSDWGGKDVTNYFASLKQNEIDVITAGIKSYETILKQMNIAGVITVTGGLYTSLNDFVNKGVSKAFIDAVTDADTNTIYKQWSAYAKSIKATVSEAIGSAVSSYVGATRSFKEWQLGSGTVAQQEFTSKYLADDLQNLASSMGVAGVTAENFLSMYQDAIKESFTPETIEKWNTLGEAIKKATDANNSYTESLKASTAFIPTDMMLQKTGATKTAVDIKQLVNQQGAQTEQTAQLVAVLTETVKVLKKQLTIAQIGNNQGIPA